MCKAGTCCGGCRPAIEGLLRQVCGEARAEACAPPLHRIVIQRKAA